MAEKNNNRNNRGGARTGRGSGQPSRQSVSDETRRYGGLAEDVEAAMNSEYEEPYEYGGYDPVYDYGYQYDAPDPYGNSGERREDWYRNAGSAGSTGQYRDAYRRTSGPSMAARASGKANNEIYGGRSEGRGGNRRSRSSAAHEQPSRGKRRRRRHPLRRFIVFLLIVAAILAGGYFMLFRAPAKAQVSGFTRKAGMYNILLCATDAEGYRTDTIMLLTINQKDFSVSLTSLPRDTIVDSGDAVPKLNAVYTDAGCGEAGAEALMDQVQTLLGFRPDGYVVISYQVFKDAVDAMGGVWFDVPMDMDINNANDSSDMLHISAGEQLLDGTQALGVCRFRYGYLMADIQRQYVQQNFVKAMIRQCVSPKNWLNLPAVYRAVMGNTITDLSASNLRFVALWTGIGYRKGVAQNTLPGEGVTYNGASCFGLYGQSVVNMVNEVMNPFNEEITIDDVNILSVSGGALVKSTWEGTPFDASTYQYD